MGIVEDLKKELGSARTARSSYETDWADYVKYTAPDMERGFSYPAAVQNTGMAALQGSEARKRSRHIYNSTAVWLMDRLVNGVESLTFPKGMHWHGVAYDDPFAPEPSQGDEEYFERLQDYLFRIRYSGRSGFELANRAATASACKLGTGILFPIENEQLSDIKAPVFYRYVPVYEMYLIVDGQGNDCGFFRARQLEAWQAVREYNGKVSAELKRDAEDPNRKTNKATFIHACFLRDGGIKGAVDSKRSEYESVHFEEKTGHINRQSAFFEFPLVIRRWDRDGLSPYGSPPQAKLMGDIKSLQSLARDDLTASSQSVRPPIATHKSERPLDLNPGRVNPGLIDEAGRPLFRSMVDTVNPGAANAKVQEIEERLRIGLYGDLWQTLLEGSGRTATEATIRAQEKADMIGPFTSNIQAPNSVMFDREVGIIGRRGAFQPGSPLEPTESVAEMDISVRSTSPIDQMREAGSFEGLANFKEYQAAAMQTNPGAADWVDEEEERKLAQRSLGLPAKLLRSMDEIAKDREARAEQQAQQEQLAAGESVARMAKDAAPLAQMMGEQNGNGMA